MLVAVRIVFTSIELTKESFKEDLDRFLAAVFPSDVDAIDGINKELSPDDVDKELSLDSDVYSESASTSTVVMRNSDVQLSSTDYSGDS